ncbi:phosphatase PAP2 family protein [Aquimarina sp. 2201CG5-10]|uniref:phosphatase PAP2 family protein n=1 Tax=Aquimarina callyspongiae TaxID=3098150 RepID=UPI002AC8CB3F|nr:phosphatase PAP2 family protein [Aquimarina sp. 2201CG5-10]
MNLLLLTSCSSNSQDIHSLEPVKNHYKSLEKYSTEINSQRSDLDKIQFPLDGRTSGRGYIGIEPTYLKQKDVNYLKQNIQFPANSSDQTRAELDYLLELEDKRTGTMQERSLEIARIGYWPPYEKDHTIPGRNTEHLFWEYGEVMTKDYDAYDYPATLKLLAGVTRDMRIIEFTIKYHLLRARPYHLEPKLNPMARISSPSFASGHTLWAYIQAFVWSELLPNKRKEFLNIAYEVGESREIMGIHYPSDEEAARKLAHEMLVLMLKNPDFKEDLLKAKEEWRKK